MVANQTNKIQVCIYTPYTMAVKLAQLIQLSLSVREVASSSPVRFNAVRSNALVRVECAWNSLGQGTDHVETRTKLEELIPAAMVIYGLNRVQRPLWLQQFLIKWFPMVWFPLDHSGQQTSVKCAEAAWNYKAGGVVHLKSHFPLFFVYLRCPSVPMLWSLMCFVSFSVRHTINHL